MKLSTKVNLLAWGGFFVIPVGMMVYVEAHRAFAQGQDWKSTGLNFLSWLLVWSGVFAIRASDELARENER